MQDPVQKRSDQIGSPKDLGEEAGQYQWKRARVKRFLEDTPRRQRVFRESLSEYLDGRIEKMDLPDPLPTRKERYAGTIVWGARTWDLPVAPEHLREEQYLQDEEAAWVYTYRAVTWALQVGRFRAGFGPHHAGEKKNVEVKDHGGQVMATYPRDAIVVFSPRPLSEDEHGRVPSYVADVVDSTLAKIHQRLVERQIQKYEQLYENSRISPSVDRVTGELLNTDRLEKSDTFIQSATI